ncbi:MAG: transposase [Acidobacteriota bacterium]|nr:transposase [Acidobacteriota bacterium]
MSRPLRLEYPGSLWHITVRGNCRQGIYYADSDRNLFLELLGRCVTHFEWILYAYVLMPNHFHLVVQLTSETLSRGMQWLNFRYAQAINRRHQRVGHLYQGRFNASLIEKETYFLEVLRYVVLNPVRARMVTRPEDYAWSSHRAVLGTVESPEWLAVDDVLAQFAPWRDLARVNYRQFVDAAIGADASPWAKRVGIYLGSETWMKRVQEQVDLKPRADEHPRMQRVVQTPTMARVIAAVATTLSVHEGRIRHGRGGVSRMIVAWIAWHEAMLTLRQIAAGLRLRSAGHASYLIRGCDEKLARNRVLQDCIDRCRSTLRGENRKTKA